REDVCGPADQLGATAGARGGARPPSAHLGQQLARRRSKGGMSMRPTQDQLWMRDHADGLHLYHDGRHPEAEAKLRSALRHARAAHIADARLAATLYQLAILGEERGHSAEALDFYRRALETEERVLGADHPFVAMILRPYAALLRRTHCAAQAAACEARAERIWNGDTTGPCADWNTTAA